MRMRWLVAKFEVPGDESDRRKERQWEQKEKQTKRRDERIKKRKERVTGHAELQRSVRCPAGLTRRCSSLIFSREVFSMNLKESSETTALSKSRARPRLRPQQTTTPWKSRVRCRASFENTCGLRPANAASNVQTWNLAAHRPHPYLTKKM